VLVEMAAAKPRRLRPTSSPSAMGRGQATETSKTHLCGADRRPLFSNVALDWNKEIGQRPFYAPGKAQPKKPSEHKIVGQPLKREGHRPPRFYCQQDFVTDVKVPGMVAWPRPSVRRWPAPPPVSVDESSVKDIPGVKVVRDKDLIGRRRPTPSGTPVKAAQMLKVTWSNGGAGIPRQYRPPPSTTHIRKAQVAQEADRRQGKSAMSTKPSSRRRRVIEGRV